MNTDRNEEMNDFIDALIGGLVICGLILLLLP